MTACFQINLQTGFGGGEVYAATFAKAIADAGLRSVLVRHPEGESRRRMTPPGVEGRGARRAEDLPALMAQEPPCWMVFHHIAPAPVLAALATQGHLVTAFVHMPLYGRNPEPLRPFHRLFAVSRHVIASLAAEGFSNVHDEPLYGIAALDRGDGTERSGGLPPIQRHSRYEWDRRKGRDQLLGLLEPVAEAFRPAAEYQRRPGLTLGVVSRLTPIKQFPLLFSCIAPVLARHRHVNVEIFGSGGYASVRDLDRAIRGLGAQVRFWGEQRNVAAVYRQIDALLTGLPEKEALGLNVLEAQACATPVLAPDAPPFDETVLEGVTGLRFRDPRQDGGAGFEQVLQRMGDGGFHFDAAAAQAHLARFAAPAFLERTRRLVAAMADQLSS